MTSHSHLVSKRVTWSFSRAWTRSRTAREWMFRFQDKLPNSAAEAADEEDAAAVVTVKDVVDAAKGTTANEHLSAVHPQTSCDIITNGRRASGRSSCLQP